MATQLTPETIAAYYHDIFEVDKRGIAIFEDLYARFAAPAKVHTDGGIDAVLKTYAAAARRDVVEHIVRMVNKHLNAPELPQQPENADEIPS